MSNDIWNDELWGNDPRVLAAALAWQLELGAVDAIDEEPIDRFAAEAAARAKASLKRPASKRPEMHTDAPAGNGAPSLVQSEAAQLARDLAAGCRSLEELREAVHGFDSCPLKAGARSTVFADGRAGARLMVIGEGPGRDEDKQGLPFVGASGQLLDRMLAAIGLDRHSPDLDKAAYITNVVPWRPEGNRTPSDDEVAMLLPFLRRHIELAKPDFLLLLGNTPTRALLEMNVGITRARGKWGKWKSYRAIPSFHPAFLLRQPVRKREAWADLLALKLAMEEIKQP